ncbi:MAG: c-type cytochrome domain-containing protein, partial [Chthoniobacteraceae bacterium]
MFRCPLILFAIFFAALRGEAAPDFATDIRPLIETYCFKCHGEERAKADLRLDESADLAGVYQHV